MIRITGKERTEFFILRRHDERHILGAGIAQNPFDIAIGTQLALGPTLIGNRQTRKPNRLFGIHNMGEFQSQFAVLRRERGVAMAVAGFIGDSFVAQHIRCWCKAAARFAIKNIDRLARTVGDRIICPRGKLIITAIACPGKG